MRPLLLFSLTLLSTYAKAQYDFQNMSLLSRFDDSSVVAEPVYGIRYQSCWGWVDPADGREYGIIGSTAGTYIIEVTDPYQPVVRDYVPGRSTARIWHEYKTYQQYLYMISDGGSNSLQIADMSYLPDSVHVIYDSTGVFDSGHTLYVDGDHLYVASVSKPGTPSSSMNVYSLASGPTPVLLRRLDQDYPAINSVHDMYVVHDTVFASCGYQGLYIFRYDPGVNRFIQLGSLTTYPDQGYNHSSFLDQSHTVLYMCDEVPDAMAIKAVDVSDLNNPTVVDTFSSHPGNTPHNPYVLGNVLFVASYQDGVQAYDITQPGQPVRTGFFDTHPQNPPGIYPYPPYAGCWAVYTDLPSGHLLASDMQQGLFVLDMSQLMAVQTGPRSSNTCSIYPNPAQSSVDIALPFGTSSVVITDVVGQLKLLIASDATTTHLSLNVSEWQEGIYFVCVAGKNSSSIHKLVVSHR